MNGNYYTTSSTLRKNLNSAPRSYLTLLSRRESDRQDAILQLRCEDNEGIVIEPLRCFQQGCLRSWLLGSSRAELTAGVSPSKRQKWSPLTDVNFLLKIRSLHSALIRPRAGRSRVRQ